MNNFTFDTSHFLNHLDIKEKAVKREGKQVMHDIVDDLARISSNLAPIKRSNLRKSHSKEVEVEGSEIRGDVAFSVVEKDGSGSFNYALWTHEMEYDLGPQSADSPGTDGYHVGNKYLERPLQGEANKYLQWKAQAISRVLD